MGKHGPPKQPTALRILHGEHRPSQINTDEPVPSARPLEPPAELAEDAREVWDYTLAELQHMKIVTAADRDLLFAYCQAVARHRRATKLLDESPVLIRRDGQVAKNPAVQVQRDAAHEMRVLAQEFGLTPSARTSIRVGPSSELNEVERLLS